MLQSLHSHSRPPKLDGFITNPKSTPEKSSAVWAQLSSASQLGYDTWLVHYSGGQEYDYAETWREALDVVTVFLSLPIAGDNWSPPNCFMVPVSISLLTAELCFLVRVTPVIPRLCVRLLAPLLDVKSVTSHHGPHVEDLFMSLW